MVRLLLRLAWRNLWRNRRRTGLTLSAMVLSVAFLIFMLAVWEGMLEDTLASVTRTYYGHVQVARRGYFAHPQVWKTVPLSWRSRLLADEQVSGVSGRVETFVLLVSDRSSSAVRLLGVDGPEEREVTDLLSRLRGGFPRRGEIALGEALARSLGVKAGDTVGILGQAADGSLLAENLVVRGILHTGNPQVDGHTALLDRSFLQDLLGLEDRVHVLVLRLRDPFQVEAWDFEGLSGEEEWRTWMDFLPAIAQILRVWRASEIFFGMLFYIAVVLVSLNTLYMMFFERVHEFAVWMAMGLRRRLLFGLVVLEGTWLALMAAGMGGLLGLVLAVGFHRFPLDLSFWLDPVTYEGAVIPPRLYAVPNRYSVGIPVALFLVEAILITLVPAQRLRKLDVPRLVREVRG